MYYKCEMSKKEKKLKKISGKTQVRNLPLSKIKKLDSLWRKLGKAGHSFSDTWWIFNLNFIFKFYEDALVKGEPDISNKEVLGELILELENIIKNKKKEKEAR